MPEPKKPSINRPFEAKVDSALDGLRLERPANAANAANAARSTAPSAGHKQLPPAPEEPDLVSKLIDFIKSM